MEIQVDFVGYPDPNGTNAHHVVDTVTQTPQGACTGLSAYRQVKTASTSCMVVSTGGNTVTISVSWKLASWA